MELVVADIVQEPWLSFSGGVARRRVLLKHVRPSSIHFVYPRLHNFFQNIDESITVNFCTLFEDVGRYDVTFAARNAQHRDVDRKLGAHHDGHFLNVICQAVLLVIAAVNLLLLNEEFLVVEETKESWDVVHAGANP